MSLRVIVAEDETIIRLDLKERLEGASHQVIGENPLARERLYQMLHKGTRWFHYKPGWFGDFDNCLWDAPVVLVTAHGEQALIERASEAGVIGYCLKPLRDKDLESAISVALSRYSEFQEMSQTATDLSEQLETRKSVERAKGILMTKHDLPEPEAFKRIQKMSMDRRRSMRDIAEAIILAEDI